MALLVNGRKHLIPALLLIYRPRKDERLSWPSWLTCSGWFTHISGHPSAAGRAQDRESSPVRDRRSTTVPRHQPTYTISREFDGKPVGERIRRHAHTHTHAQTDGQVENIILSPPIPWAVGGITNNRLINRP